MMRPLLLVAALGLAGLAVADEPASTAGILRLKLPASTVPTSSAPDGVSKLVIDGKDYSTPRLERRTLEVEPKKGTDSVTVVYTFWPNGYTRFTPTKVVKVVPGKAVEVSFEKPDPKRPDKTYVIHFPTPIEVADAMCKLGGIGEDDVVYDIGCGDGRLVIRAVQKFGAKKAVGIDISPERIAECRPTRRRPASPTR